LSNNNNKGQIYLKKLAKVLWANKYKFILTFIIVLAIGISASLVSPSYYALDNNITLIDRPENSDIFLIENFPHEKLSPWLFPSSNNKTGKIEIMENIRAEVESEDFLNKLKYDLGFKNSLSNLEESIYINQKNELISLKIVSQDENNTLEIARKLLIELKQRIQTEIETSFYELVGEIDKELESVSEILSVESKMELEQTKITEFESLEKQLILARQTLLENKEDYVNRVKIVEDVDISDVYLYNPKSKNIFLSIGWALFCGLAVSYAKYFFLILKS